MQRAIVVSMDMAVEGTLLSRGVATRPPRLNRLLLSPMAGSEGFTVRRWRDRVVMRVGLAWEATVVCHGV